MILVKILKTSLFNIVLFYFSGALIILAITLLHFGDDLVYKIDLKLIFCFLLISLIRLFYLRKIEIDFDGVNIGGIKILLNKFGYGKLMIISSIFSILTFFGFFFSFVGFLSSPSWITLSDPLAFLTLFFILIQDPIWMHRIIEEGDTM